jgi:hypothetical protein
MSEFIQCSCDTHAISVDVIPEEDTVIISMWQFVEEVQRGRFYWMWQALKGHRYNVTELVLDNNTATQLINAIQNN